MMQPTTIAPATAPIMMGHMYRAHRYDACIAESAGIVGVGKVGYFGPLEEKDVEVVESAWTRRLEMRVVGEAVIVMSAISSQPVNYSSKINDTKPDASRSTAQILQKVPRK